MTILHFAAVVENQPHLVALNSNTRAKLGQQDQDIMDDETKNT